jgi:hypothetical protein
MPVSWKPSTSEEHEALPTKHHRKHDPEWDALLDELDKGNTVIVEYQDDKEHNMLARSLGRRAALRGFKVDLRNGDGYISVRKADAASSAKPRKARASKAAS